MKHSIKPRLRQVLIKVISFDDMQMSGGGIIVKSDARTPKNYFKVLEVGPDAKSITVGMTVVANLRGAEGTVLDGESVFILDEDYIVAIVTEEGSAS